ncbi:MAG TPA: SDR family oxidoreductase [Fimbriimonadaceae bacterium]|nr:SDR family oxidoreductase [Fimbriimonadaceae bacterium]
MEGRRVLVTGSSRGIGRAIALRLAQHGWTVALHYAADAKECEKVRKLLGPKAGGMYSADLANPANADKLWREVQQDGPIHALVNNAGVYMPIDFVAAGDAALEANHHRTFAVNFESPLRLTRHAARHFVEQGGGKILNVASRVGFKGEGGAALYAASKAALINLTRSLAVELASKNIQLFGIAPGWVETAMVRQGMEERLTEILETIPLGRMGTPEDCAAAAEFLLSDDASYLSGVVIDINGASYFH